jgi:hypothetical protein
MPGEILVTKPAAFAGVTEYVGMEPTSPISVVLDFAAFWLNKLGSVIVAGVLFLVAYLTNFSVPIGIMCFFLGIAALAWNIRSARLYVGVGVIIIALSLGLLNSALGVNESSTGKQSQAAAKPEVNRAAQGSNDNGVKQSPATSSKPKAQPSSTLAAVRPYFGALIIFAIFLGAIVFMGKEFFRESKGFLVGRGKN